MIHETHDFSRLNFRKIKDGHQPAPRGDDNFLSGARENQPIISTLIWEPAHPPPKIACTAAQYPAFASFIQLEGTAPFTSVYLNVCQTKK
jgi:hypothetical protein